jgi:hypothetical protein
MIFIFHSIVKKVEKSTIINTTNELVRQSIDIMDEALTSKPMIEGVKVDAKQEAF